MTERPAPIVFDPIEAAIADLQQGKMVVVVDDENRENEGDLIGAAQFATPAMINFMALRARGLICLAATPERLDELKLPLMVERNTDRNETAFTVSVDAMDTSTGISAEDRSRTVQAFVNPLTKPEDLRRPGHVFPLRSRPGGVLKRAGHTEAAVDLARLSGLYPAGVICEIQNEDGSMARLPELWDYARQYDLKLINIADLIAYRLTHERFVHREAQAKLPSQFGDFDVYAYRNELDNTEHLAIVKGQPETWGDRPVLVRVHSECLTGDALGSLRCDCRGQLQSALKMVENAGEGAIVYLRQEGRGIGLMNKIKAYAWQDAGLDTVEANVKLGFGADLRTYGVGAQILTDLGIHQMRLITNNPRKISGLKGFNLTVVERVPLLIEANEFNSFYLQTKAEKLGHLLPAEGILLGLVWHQPPGLHTVYLDKLRAALGDMLLQEDTTPAAAQRLGLAQRHGLPLNATIARVHGNRPNLGWLTLVCREALTWPGLGEVRLGLGAVETIATVRLADAGDWQPDTLYVVQR